MASDSLYDLIQSLTKSEKRYFKLLSSRHTIGEENNYVILFNYIENQSEYDEKQLMDHFKGEAFLHKFSITKKRLYNHILNALDNFHSQANLESQIFKLIHSADILSKKSLYIQAKKTLLSAEKLAKKNELNALLAHIRLKIKALIENNNYLDIPSEEIEEIWKEDMAILKSSEEESKLWHLKSKVFQHLSFHGIARTENEKLLYSNFYKEYLASPISDKSSSESKYLAYHLLSAYYFSIQNFDKSFEMLQNNLRLFQENNHLTKNHPDRYFSILTNLIYTAENLNLPAISSQYLADLKLFEKEVVAPSNDVDLQIRLFSTLASIELTTQIKQGDYDTAVKNLERIETQLMKYEIQISPVRKAFIRYKIACVYLATAHPNFALKNLRKILNDNDLDKKEDIVSFAHLLELFVHIELGDLEFLNFACRTSKRFLSSRKRLFDFEHELLSFAQKYSSVKDKFEAEERWEKLHQKLQKLITDPFQATALEYFDFLTWAKAKATNTQFATLCKDLFLKRILPAA